jgi:hypothetical protein
MGPALDGKDTYGLFFDQLDKIRTILNGTEFCLITGFILVTGIKSYGFGQVLNGFF